MIHLSNAVSGNELSPQGEAANDWFLVTAIAWFITILVRFQRYKKFLAKSAPRSFPHHSLLGRRTSFHLLPFRRPIPRKHPPQAVVYLPRRKRSRRSQPNVPTLKGTESWPLIQRSLRSARMLPHMKLTNIRWKRFVQQSWKAH